MTNESTELLTGSKFEVFLFSADSIRVVSFDQSLSMRLNRWLGYPYGKGNITAVDEPVFKVPVSNIEKLNKILTY